MSVVFQKAILNIFSNFQKFGLNIYFLTFNLQLFVCASVIFHKKIQSFPSAVKSISLGLQTQEINTSKNEYCSTSAYVYFLYEITFKDSIHFPLNQHVPLQRFADSLRRIFIHKAVVRQKHVTMSFIEISWKFKTICKRINFAIKL